MRRSADPLRATFPPIVRCTLALRAGDVEAAARQLARLEELRREHSHRGTDLQALALSALMGVLTEPAVRAEQAVQRFVEVASQPGVVAYTGWLPLSTGAEAVQQGLERGLPVTGAARVVDRLLGRLTRLVPAAAPVARLHSALLARAAGGADDARQRLHGVVEVATSYDTRYELGRALRALADLEARDGRPAQGLADRARVELGRCGGLLPADTGQTSP